MNRKRAIRIKSVLIAMGCVVALPVVVPCMLVKHAVADRRRKRDADSFHCVRCGNILGQASVGMAGEDWIECFRELRKQYPGVRLRTVRDVWAICAACNTRYDYCFENKTYILKQDESIVAVAAKGTDQQAGGSK